MSDNRTMKNTILKIVTVLGTVFALTLSVGGMLLAQTVATARAQWEPIGLSGVRPCGTLNIQSFTVSLS